jgi:hypothetical protein
MASRAQKNGKRAAEKICCRLPSKTGKVVAKSRRQAAAEKSQ